MSCIKTLRFSAKHSTYGPIIGIVVVDGIFTECYFKYYEHFAPTSVEVLQSPDYSLTYRSLDDLVSSCLSSGYKYLKFYD